MREIRTSGATRGAGELSLLPPTLLAIPYGGRPRLYADLGRPFFWMCSKTSQKRSSSSRVV